MKKRWQTGIYLLLYVFLLTCMLDFDIRSLLDIKSLFILLVGTFLLAMPFYYKGISREEFLYIYGTKAFDAGLLQVFLLCFVRLSENKGNEEILKDIALCFRPMLYAFCIRLILLNENAERFPAKEAGHAERSIRVIDKDIIPSYEECKAAGLTRREAEIALLICRRYSNKEIADELVISEKTVKKHISNIFEKTGISRREELMQYLTSGK